MLRDMRALLLPKRQIRRLSERSQYIRSAPLPRHNPHRKAEHRNAQPLRCLLPNPPQDCALRGAWCCMGKARL